MLRFLRLAALVVPALLCPAPLAAQTTPAPPAWQDGRGASVYLQMNQQTETTSAAENTDQKAGGASIDLPYQAPTNSISAPKFDPAVLTVAHQATTAESQPLTRRLAPPSNRNDVPTRESSHVGARRILDFGMPAQSIYTVVTALAIVIGAFLLFAWALKRGGKNVRGRRSTVPADAVSALGRVTLAGRQQAELLRIGNKLILVAFTPSGPATLTEVTDPVEVDRLVGLCQQVGSYSSSKAFEQVFQQFSNEPVSGAFLGDEPLPTSLSSAASAYRSHRGVPRV
jgi:flagellar biogenesis protein FliO